MIVRGINPEVNARLVENMGIGQISVPTRAPVAIQKQGPRRLLRTSNDLGRAISEVEIIMATVMEALLFYVLKKMLTISLRLC